MSVRLYRIVGNLLSFILMYCRLWNTFWSFRIIVSYSIGYHFVADFTHAHASIAGPRAHVCGQSRQLNGNHVKPYPARDQNIPGSPLPYSLHANLNNHARGRAWLQG